MKKSVFIILILLISLSMEGFSQKRMGVKEIKPDTLSADSLEYRLIIIDPGFDSWLATKPSKEFYSQKYYEQKNYLYVTEWNHRYITGRNNGLYDTYIDYKPGTDYGLDLNYRLFYYFRYFEESNHLRLIGSVR